jgi:23S rRNA pseudouridine1911/1915/1917 synthase
LEKLFDIIHEDENLLVINKPAGLVCHPTKGDEYSSLISRARIYLERTASHNVAELKIQDSRFKTSQPHLIHRLDRETSGIVLLAKNPVTAGELGKIWETRAVTKEYLAIVHGHLAAEQGVIDAPLGKDEHSPVAIKDCVRPDGAPAQTEFRVEKRFLKIISCEGREAHETNPVESNNPSPASHPSPDDSELKTQNSKLKTLPFTLLRLTPKSGRKHQIRIHLAHLGHPIVGDKIYGGDPDLYLALVENRLTDGQRARLILPHHALHAVRLQFDWRGRTRQFYAQPDGEFYSFCGQIDSEYSLNL